MCQNSTENVAQTECKRSHTSFSVIIITSQIHKLRGEIKRYQLTSEYTLPKLGVVFESVWTVSTIMNEQHISGYIADVLKQNSLWNNYLRTLNRESVRMRYLALYPNVLMPRIDSSVDAFGSFQVYAYNVFVVVCYLYQRHFSLLWKHGYLVITFPVGS